MQSPAVRPSAVLGIVLAGASIVAIAPTALQLSDAQLPAVQLTGADSPLGDGTALIMGDSGIPLPSQLYLDAADELYLQPRGFTGAPEALFTPNALYPITGVKSLPTDTSFAQGQQILDAAILREISGGHVDAANPVTVFGWSQSSSVASLTMSQLAEQGVPSGDVHFVLVGDPSAPNGGLLERFDVPDGTSPSFPSLGITFSGATPADLYPTDIYTVEYDGFADFPQYPINLLSDINAFLGLGLAHLEYLGLTPEQLTPEADGGQAIQLPTSAADTLTDYYMIPDQALPLLQPLQLLPVVGQPLYDLLEPDARILVNLGYGSITDGWSQGDADVPTTFGLWPTDIDPSELSTALDSGLQEGISDALAQLQNPGNYEPTPTVDSPPLSTLLSSLTAMFGVDLQHAPPDQVLDTVLRFIGFPTSDATLGSPPADVINTLTSTISADYGSLLPVGDSVAALLTGLPAYDAEVFLDQLEAGDLIGAIADPIAADVALAPLLGIMFTLAPVGEAALGSLVNLAELF